MRISLFRSACTVLCFLLVIHGNAQTPCVISCPSNIITQATSTSGAVVDYSISSSGDCGTIISLPTSGSTFPIGTTTVNVYRNPSQLVYALKANTLVTFNLSDPSVVSSPLTITGLQIGESIRSIDFRVSDGKLFAVGITGTSGGYVGRLYTINILTGASAQVGSETFPLPGGIFFGPGVSIDIDPRDNMIRLVTDEDLNMRISSNTGAYTVDGVLDPNNRSVSGVAYSNNIPFATTTTLYDIGFGTQIPIGANTLYIQDPNKGTLEEIGTTGIGAFSGSFGFDISQTGDALVSATRSTGTFPNFQQVPTLYRINLQNGLATNIGTIGTAVEDITIAPVSFTEPSCSFTVTVTPPPPTVTINKAASQADPTTTTPVKFTVEFSEEVTGFDESDISFEGSTVTGTLSATVTGSGTTYEIAVSGMTSAGNVVASVPAGSASNSSAQLNIASTSTDNVVFLSGVPPTITCSGDITVNSPQGGCSANVLFTGENDIQINGTGNFNVLFYVSNNGETIASGINLPSSYNFPSGVNNVQVTISDEYGSATCNFKVTVIDNQPPVLNCSNQTVDAEPGKCYADVPILISGTENCTGPTRQVIVTSSVTGLGFTSGTGNFSNVVNVRYSVGTHTIDVMATDAAGNTATCSITITVRDTQSPVITSKPADVTVECSSQIPEVDISSVAATDNCGTATITHVDDVISNQTCANRYTITRIYKATDGSGNTATATQIITIDDQTPPQIINLTPSKRILAPPNHRMVNITLDYTLLDNCLTDPDVTINITSNEPVNGTGDGDTDPDWEIIDDHHIRLRAERSAQGTGRIYTITVTVNDGCNPPVSASTEVVVAHNITGPQSGSSFKVGSSVAFTGEFWDTPGNTHTAKWLIDGSTSAKAVVTEPAGNKNGKVTGSYKFTSPGVYKLQMNVTDQKGVTTYANTNGDVDAIVVIYDPNGGNTYGGGYFNSPAGALVANPSSTGKASYGFAMNYFKNSTNPKGETQFEFKVGEFEFNALNFDYLVISNSMAQFKGTGKIIGGQSGIGFIMTVVDGQLDGTGVDKIRLKIYNKNNGRIIYDNQMGASDAALPTQAVGANSMVVISGTNSGLTNSNTTTKQGEMEAAVPEVSNGLEVIAYPNPSTTNFSLTVQSNSKEKTLMQVFDQYGRLVEARNNISVGSIVRLGDKYRSGVYYVRVLQGKQHKDLKLVKLNW